MTEDRWLTRAQAAQRVGKTERTIRAWVTSNQVRPIAGRIRESELLAADKANRDRMHAGRPKRVEAHQ